MPLNPLSQELQKKGYGYQLDEQTKINHLFYVDDLKLYGTNDNQQTGLINKVKNVLGNIKMEVCKGIIQERQESFSWGNPTEWQTSDTRPWPNWNIQVPGNGGGRRSPMPQNKGQDHERV